MMTYTCGRSGEVMSAGGGWRMMEREGGRLYTVGNIVINMSLFLLERCDVVMESNLKEMGKKSLITFSE